MESLQTRESIGFASVFIRSFAPETRDAQRLSAIIGAVRLLSHNLTRITLSFIFFSISLPSFPEAAARAVRIVPGSIPGRSVHKLHANLNQTGQHRDRCRSSTGSVSDLRIGEWNIHQATRLRSTYCANVRCYDLGNRQ
jgi:hypothetical protein